MFIEMVTNKSISTDWQRDCVGSNCSVQHTDTGQHQMTFYSLFSQKHQPVLFKNANQRKRRHIQSCTKIRK